MAAALKIPAYHAKDLVVLVASMLPMAILTNYFLYGDDYFGNTGNFLLATLVSFAFFGGGFLTYGFVAVSLRNRFPNDSELIKRLAICLSIFFLLSAFYMSLLLLVYDYFSFLGYRYSENDFLKSYFTLVVMNIFLTFLNEGVYRFENLRATVIETEKLKTEYMHSQLLGLKSQMNPHFLFNGLNTLSSLIHEDADKAEEFLDHMSKVYRYLLRNNEERLVSIGTELSFVRSYYFLLKARHADGLEIKTEVPAFYLDHLIPPLTLQMIIENTINNNSISRSMPLGILITANNDCLEISHTIQPKMNTTEEEEAFENIKNKYWLLCQKHVSTVIVGHERKISLPLIPKKELLTA
jgi:two-component system, LytTR family, sensor kinase